MSRTPGAHTTDIESTVDPTVNDDVTQALDVGSRWINTSTNTIWFCSDNSTGAAIWDRVDSPKRNITTSDPSVSNDDAEGYEIGSMWINTITDEVFVATDVTPGAAVWKQVSKVRFDMTLGGCLAVSDLPLLNAGIEIVGAPAVLATFAARRGVPETSGTTTIQLEINGSAVGGATLSWTSADAAFALKSVAISQAVVADDRVSFRLTSAGVDAEDIFAEARS